MSGTIYLITNTVTDKHYVGITRRDLQDRWQDHKTSSRTTHDCPALYNAMRKYGVDHFTISPLDYASSENELNAKERHWIAELDTLVPNGYNILTGGTKGYSPANKGRKLSDETRRKMSAAHKGIYKPYAHTPEALAKRVAKLRGKNASLVTRLKMSESQTKRFNKFYLFTDPNGVTTVGRSRHAFCKEHKLCTPAMAQHGHTKGYSCREITEAEYALLSQQLLK